MDSNYHLLEKFSLGYKLRYSLPFNNEDVQELVDENQYLKEILESVDDQYELGLIY